MSRLFIFTKQIITTLILVLCFAGRNLPAQQKTMDAAELYQAIQKLNTLGSVLYFAAHPDDENNPLLAYFSNEMMLRTGYLSLTRGDGGQNLIGTEKGALIGLIRTQELLRAREMEGTEQFFTRAVDFGYTKNPDETFKFWDHDKILADAVFVIRIFRPDIIITRFPTTGEGRHGQHTASAIIAEEAFEAAGDYDRFPEQLQYVTPWQPKKLFWNAWEQVLMARDIDLKTIPAIDAGVYNPVLGKSYTELGAESRSQHKSQAMGTAKRVGPWPNYFLQLKGVPARRSLFDDIDITWQRIPGSEKFAKLIQRTLQNFSFQNRDHLLQELLAAWDVLQKLPKSQWVNLKKVKLAEIIRECAGLQFQALADDYTVVPSGTIALSTSAIARSTAKIELLGATLESSGEVLLSQQKMQNNQPVSQQSSLKIPAKMQYSEVYWLKSPATKGTFAIDDPAHTGEPQSAPQLMAKFDFLIEGRAFNFTSPVQYKWLDQRHGDKYREVVVAPPVTLQFDEKVHIFADASPQKIRVTVRSNIKNASGNLTLKAPAGWEISPAQQFSIAKKYGEQPLWFTISPPEQSENVTISAVANFQGKNYAKQQIIIDYPHIPIQNVLLPAKLQAVRLQLKRHVRRLAYINGAGDEIPENLRSIGYEVTLLSGDDLDKKDLRQFEAIIAGVRAYNTRSELKQKNIRLLEYVKNGGTYVVQYNTSYALKTEAIGPYPLTISHDRVTVEEAPMEMLDKNHPIFHSPNKISATDFAGWVQERGLYFPNKWDERYRPLLGCNDPGEPQTRGSLLYTRYGKGVFIYTGLSFFRQLPAGVPGAYRLFVNLIESGKRLYKR